MKLQNRIRITAPLWKVWEITQDIVAWPRWTPTITSVRSISPEPVGPASRFLVKQPLQKPAVWTITEFVPDRRLAWEREWNGATLRATHVVEGEGSGTISTLILEGPPVPWIMTLILNYALQVENRCLKSACERNASPSPLR